MKAKECLRELQRMDVEIKAMREQISVLENEAEGVQALRYSDLPKGGKVRDTADVLAEIADLQKICTARIEALTEKRRVAMSVIAGIERTELRSVLLLRYCLGKSWNEISEELNYSRRSILRMHGDALQAFDACWHTLAHSPMV